MEMIERERAMISGALISDFSVCVMMSDRCWLVVLSTSMASGVA